MLGWRSNRQTCCVVVASGSDLRLLAQRRRAGCDSFNIALVRAQSLDTGRDISCYLPVWFVSFVHE